MKTCDVENCREQCLFELAQLIDEQGLFPAVRMMNGEVLGTSDTIFVTSIILVMLASCKSPTTEKISARVLQTLVKERSRAGAWNYWQHDSPSRAMEPYPDDIDDTFMAMTAIALWRPQLVDKWKKEIGLVLDTQRSREGLYRTWIGAGVAGNDIDPVANAAVLLYKNAAGESVESGLSRMLKRLSEKEPESLYYSSKAYKAYILAKAGIMPDFLFKERCAIYLTVPCEGAFLASALMLACSKEHEAIQALILNICDTSDRAALYPIYREKIFKDGSATEIASPALSLAACAEACSLYIERYG